MAIITAKILAIFFALATTAFCVSTIVLAVQKSNLEDDLQDALDMLDLISSYTTTTPTTVTPTITTSISPGSSTSTTVEPNTSSTANPINSSTPITTTTTPSNQTTEFPWPTLTVTQEIPNWPTLPPGLVDPDEVIYRLPDDLYPVKYALYLQPDFETKTLTGTVSVQIEIVKETNLIVLHAKDLEIEGVSILNMMAKMRIRIKTYYLAPEREMFFIELEELLYKSTAYTVSISYSTTLEGLTGAYASSYLDEDGVEKWIATSKFEPTYARQAFPCFDEPALKASFTITVAFKTESGYHALSNMNEDEKFVNGDLTEVVFSQSVKMSTYLVCFIVSNFAHKSRTINGTVGTAEDFELRVFATPAQVDKVDYALETAGQITEYYIDYFQTSYPLPKLDMAAIPDFSSGAMEHWGLITYRETALLYDPAISSSANKQRVAVVIAHELAHMWFGNLVTMKWWNDLWLNEGFASYIEYKGVNKVHPEWNMLDQFLIADLHGVLKFDATVASHPIVQTVESPSQITELFDSITYSKGAAVIRMLEDLVGEENFRNATANYLFDNYFDNAVTDDFLTQIEAIGFDFDVKSIMQTWTEQMGLPVVEVTKVDNTTYKLTQKRFFSNIEDNNSTYDDSPFNYHWSIPITYTTNDNTEVQRVIFNYNDSEATVTVPNAVDWIKFNKDQVGYYRVNYAPEQWQEITTALLDKRGDFSVADRAHLINDIFALADASQLSYDIALNLSLYLKNELNYVPWSVASSQFSNIKNLLYYTDLYRDFILYVRHLLINAYESVGWTVDSDHLQNHLRVTILNAACAFGIDAANEEAANRFKEWLNDPAERPNPDIRSTIYNYGMKQAGTETLWEKVWELFIAEQDASEKIKLMESLSFVRESWMLQRYINLAFNESFVRSQDYFTCLQYISNNPIGTNLVWDYVRNNWELFVERFGIADRTLGRLIPAITKRFATQIKLEEMETFFAKYPDAGAGTTARKEALETVRLNIKWLEQNREEVGIWLLSQDL